ncbi:MAG: ATP-binding protein [Paludibacteraceae bacterium]|nr:ATP-binding protein [Paludibacteraceae bacterium]
MIKRKIINELIDWKQKHKREALLIKGARQVGKTTIVREFASKYYKHFVEINFEQDPIAKEAFVGSRDARTIISRLSAMGYGTFVPNETLVFFDEIQSCPNARTAIKFLVEDDSYDFIESGSLLGINYGDVSSYPVGFESQLEMFPLDFEEWLWANGVSEQTINDIRIAYDTKSKVDSVVHEQIMKHYRNFLVVGGMPKVVATYLGNPDFNEVVRQQRILVDSYRLDIAKYAAGQKTKAKRFFDAIPSQLSKAHKRYILSDLEKSGNMQKYGDAAQWLNDAGVAYFCYNTHSLELPFEQYENPNLFKVYLHDTGLLCSMWSGNIQWQVMQGEIDINEGALTENFVANELVKRGHRLHYYDHKSRNELDFLVAENNLLTILEVKSGSSYKQHAALNNVLSNQPERVSRVIVLSRFCSEKEELVEYLPLYMVMFL